MARFRRNIQEGRLEPVGPPGSKGNVRQGSTRWLLSGVALGLLLWVIAVPLMGDPRISYRVTPVEGGGPPILVARGSFAMTAESAKTSLAQATESDAAPVTFVQTGAMRSIALAMTLPEVARALGLKEAGNILGTAPAPIPSDAGGPVPPPPVADAPPEPTFSYPERMAPGGAPAASLGQVMNPTKEPVRGHLQPTVLGDDRRLCNQLRIAAVSFGPDAGPNLLMAGGLEDVNELESGLIMQPGERYEIVILVTLPPDLPNELQGVSCSVDFLMHFQGL